MQKLFNTELSLIQAPMAGVQNYRLAAAVCNSGGLGSLPCAMLSKEQLLGEITKLSQATGKPYNLNFFCHKPTSYTQQQKRQWHTLLAPYFTELGIDESSLGMTATRQPINNEIVELIAPFKPPVVSFHFGLPTTDIVEKIKNWGGQVISSATTVDEAKWLEANGADAVIAQGLEAGGHRGHFLSMDLNLQQSTALLVEQCIGELNIPVIAAGGIATAEDVKQMLDLGACAVQVGSAYLLCQEATTSALHRQAILNQNVNSTALTTIFSGRAARGIENRIMRELGALPPQAPAFPFASIASGALRTRSEALGASDFSPLWCGQKYITRDAVSAEDITKELMAIDA
ncbi:MULTISPECIES: nitronate monooxygenase [unclassified Pseudoalteromonas]|uniref:NAD(P)H-dependent flavin oxidoreductase n=1 Tax=unclassified Pseudoalteromonas TaxID=194690 RepID=UPI0025B39C48|nr:MULTISPECIES: nitronate monooxygenase [unclassified Pseudoalteromonas]MDN3379963.1 nitronate monooxygenase [Pseudoalteromonas sp. APC 3893]MDN3388302.1 nitronate monooxygenase [Pseudoalteromonas sp. APC 4017]